MARDWTQARAKVEEEGRCRNCRKFGPVDAAHIIPRSANARPENMTGAAVIALCRSCHSRQHVGKLDILQLLTLDEQLHAVEAAGGIVSAYRHTTGDRL
jgi:type II secretory ATPase GspE/PulE/Tfp pilus assembly ATPase PilB-like protein